MYDKERAMQERCMINEHVNKSIFANELLQIYSLFKKSLDDKELMIPEDLRKALPKTKREYLKNINFQEF
jgi:hypothetical protein